MSRERRNKATDDFMHLWLQNRWDNHPLRSKVKGSPTFWDIDCICYLMTNKGIGPMIMLEKKEYLAEMTRVQAKFLFDLEKRLEYFNRDNPGSFYGFHLLQFNATYPENSSKFYLDRKEIDVETLDKFMTKLLPDEYYISYFKKIKNWDIYLID